MKLRGAFASPVPLAPEYEAIPTMSMPRPTDVKNLGSSELQPRSAERRLDVLARGDSSTS